MTALSRLELLPLSELAEQGVLTIPGQSGSLLHHLLNFSWGRAFQPLLHGVQICELENEVNPSEFPKELVLGQSRLGPPPPLSKRSTPMMRR